MGSYRQTTSFSAALGPVAWCFVAAAIVGCSRSDRQRDTPPRSSDSLAAVRADSVARARQDSINRAQPGYVVDSIRSPEEELRRFRTGLAAATALEGGAASRDALIHAFVAAVEAADTVALQRLVVSRAEYAWLVYPSSAFSHPPYYQPIGLAWRLSTAPSERGITRLLTRNGGRSLGFVSYNCPRPPVVEGKNRIVSGCITLLRDGAETVPRRLFGAVIEREGRFKFLSYANDL